MISTGSFPPPLTPPTWMRQHIRPRSPNGKGSMRKIQDSSGKPLSHQPGNVPHAFREEMRKGRVKGAKVVFARAHRLAATAADKILKIGYSDDIVVYLNGKQVFSGKNALSYRSDDSAWRIRT